MLRVESVVEHRFPGLRARKPLITKPLITLLRLLLREKDFQQFHKDYPHLEGFDFVDQILNYFDFTFCLRVNERERVPPSGRVVIIANHPLGTLDGLALLKLIGEVRRDVKVIANDVLLNIKPFAPLLLPVDNMRDGSIRSNIKAIIGFLEQEEGALLIFPAGEVSRICPNGVRDTQWDPGFLRFASRCKAPVLPIHVNGRNSVFFYSLSMLCKPLSTLLLVREMFKQAESSVQIRIGGMVDYQNYARIDLPIKKKAKLFRRHLYRIGKGKTPILNTESAIAHPESRQLLRGEMRQCRLLGATRDNKEIVLTDYRPNSSTVREIGRLRELTFRSVGEGTGKRRDVDIYDHYYDHLVLWDDEDLEIAGAYRLVDAGRLAHERGVDQLYTRSLFRFGPPMQAIIDQGVELGRSFVQPRYWGKRGLDYLWCGVGAYLRANPHVRYLFGPVSISNRYPERAKSMLVHFYSSYFGGASGFATARCPYGPDPDQQQEVERIFSGEDYQKDFSELKSRLTAMGFPVPTLYKQYSELCEPGGVRFLAFNVDPDFSNCIDGLVVVDITMLKPSKRKRYIGA